MFVCVYAHAHVDRCSGVGQRQGGSREAGCVGWAGHWQQQSRLGGWNAYSPHSSSCRLVLAHTPDVLRRAQQLHLRVLSLPLLPLYPHCHPSLPAGPIPLTTQAVLQPEPAHLRLGSAAAPLPFPPRCSTTTTKGHSSLGHSPSPPPAAAGQTAGARAAQRPLPGCAPTQARSPHGCYHPSGSRPVPGGQLRPAGACVGGQAHQSVFVCPGGRADPRARTCPAGKLHSTGVGCCAAAEQNYGGGWQTPTGTQHHHLPSAPAHQSALRADEEVHALRDVRRHHGLPLQLLAVSHVRGHPHHLS